MPAPVVRATLQATFICFCSCCIVSFLKPDQPPHFLSLLLYSLLCTPPNFWWQHFSEAKFPGFSLQKVKVDDGGKGVEVEKRLNIQNTCIKVLLDQTIVALINTAAYIGGTRLLRGVPFDLAWKAVKEQTWPIMLAGYRLWPAVNVAQHVFVPVDQKVVVGSLVGLGWGAFLALKAA